MPESALFCLLNDKASKEKQQKRTPRKNEQLQMPTDSWYTMSATVYG